MTGKKATLNNPIYAEILYKIAERKVYPTKFVEEFINPPDKWNKNNPVWELAFEGTYHLSEEDEKKYGVKWKGDKYRKNIPTLYRQLMKLYNEGYLFIDEEQKKGKKHVKNKKYFGIRWEKIVEEFTKRAIKAEEARIKNKDDFSDYYVENLNEIKAPEFLEKAKKNKILKNFFKEIFVDIRQSLYYSRRRKKKDKHVTINELFDLILDYDLLREFSEQFDEAIGIADDEFTFRKKLDKKYPDGVYYHVENDEVAEKNAEKADKEMKKFKESFISKTLGKEYVDDYQFFGVFCVSVSPLFSNDKQFIVDLVKKDRIAYSVLHYLNFDFASKKTLEKFDEILKE